MRSCPSRSTRMPVYWLLPSTMVTRWTGPGTTLTTPPPRSCTDRKLPTETVSAPIAGIEATSAAAKIGRVERIIQPFEEYATYVALQLQRVQHFLARRSGALH